MAKKLIYPRTCPKCNQQKAAPQCSACARAYARGYRPYPIFVSFPIEEWRPVPDYEGLYSVSNLGRVRREHAWIDSEQPRLVKNLFTPRGYHVVSLAKSKTEHRRVLVHRLVAAAFIGQSNKHINHISGIKTDNRPENLEYCTNAENRKHAAAHGLMAAGERNGFSKLTAESVKEIRRLRAEGQKLKAIATRFNVTEANISLIVLRKAWAHI